ncbi:ParB/RepB/Spo0J family partition protein [Streptomyces pseudovenezuelae]|uniref:ParB family chromosome partitioning protein n=1 Tax=Streptomyces pseudovenezuelae TaxID=67350 RepID=A0ABT6M2T3_9ACTN|nr:ParB/RepB/Spo0J family partition protein [Streptomyces pseudovenezuelae]MDH6222837.1 ParB family chromosome partitioning protein [Streptomyces pseudovenezuelae]
MSDTATTTPMQRVTLRLGQIRVNERNVRQELNLDERFLKSVAANGVKVPVVVLPLGEDTYELKMGHRRYFAAQATKDTEEEQDAVEVPAYVLDPSLREAGEDFVDQLIENDDDYRRGLTDLEQADALFGAVGEGMKQARVAELTGRTRTQVSHAVKTAKTVGERTRSVLAEAGTYDLDLEALGVLGEFDDDGDAVDRLLEAYAKGRFEFQVQWEHDDRTERQARATVRPQLQAAGVRLAEDSDTLPPTAEPLAELDGPDGGPMTAEAHTGCPGHVATWAENPGEPGEVDYFCTDPEQFGHRPPQEDAPEADREGEVQRAEAAGEAKASEPSREYVKAGNKAYRAAEKARQAWLKDLIGRKSAPKPLAAFITEQLLTCPKPVAQWSGDVGRHNLIKELTGYSTLAERARTATPAKLTLLNFSVLAATFEKRMNEARTWRTDRAARSAVYELGEIRADARTWLTFLAEIGYPLSSVEQAIVDDEAFQEHEPDAADQDAEDTPDGASAEDS